MSIPSTRSTSRRATLPMMLSTPTTTSTMRTTSTMTMRSVKMQASTLSLVFKLAESLFIKAHNSIN